MAWIRSKWEVPGSKGKKWVVSIDDNGDYGCSCPAWKFRRQECKHIKAVKDAVEYGLDYGATIPGIMPIMEAHGTIPQSAPEPETKERMTSTMSRIKLNAKWGG